MTTTTATVWDAIADTPEESVALKVRADLMIAIRGTVRGWDVTQQEAARRLGITQPRLSELLSGKIAKFSLDALVSVAHRAGLEVRVVCAPARTAAPRRTAAARQRPARARTKKTG